MTIHRFDYDAAKWGHIARLFLKASEKVAIRVSHHTIVVAKHQYDFYLAQGHDLSFVKNGVTAPKFTQPEKIVSKFGLKGKDYILFLGRLVPEKRIDWLLDSFLKMNPKGIKLVIAGGSSATDKYVDSLRRQAGDNPNIIFTGYVTGRLKAELLSNARLFVIPSAVEGLPITLLEAMGYSIPCLASDIPPHKEVITDDVNGFLFDHDKQEDLLLVIEKLLSMSESKLNEISGFARELVASNYDWDDAVDKLEGIYRDLLSRRR